MSAHSLPTRVLRGDAALQIILETALDPVISPIFQAYAPVIGAWNLGVTIPHTIKRHRMQVSLEPMTPLGTPPGRAASSSTGQRQPS